MFFLNISISFIAKYVSKARGMYNNNNNNKVIFNVIVTIFHSIKQLVNIEAKGDE